MLNKAERLHFRLNAASKLAIRIRHIAHELDGDLLIPIVGAPNFTGCPCPDAFFQRVAADDDTDCQFHHIYSNNPTVSLTTQFIEPPSRQERQELRKEN